MVAMSKRRRISFRLSERALGILREVEHGAGVRGLPAAIEVLCRLYLERRGLGEFSAGELGVLALAAEQDLPVERLDPELAEERRLKAWRARQAPPGILRVVDRGGPGDA